MNFLFLDRFLQCVILCGAVSGKEECNISLLLPWIKLSPPESATEVFQKFTLFSHNFSRYCYISQQKPNLLWMLHWRVLFFVLYKLKRIIFHSVMKTKPGNLVVLNPNKRKRKSIIPDFFYFFLFYFWQLIFKELGKCQLSAVSCQLSPVSCHLSPVTCHLSTTICSFSWYESWCLVMRLWEDWWLIR